MTNPVELKAPLNYTSMAVNIYFPEKSDDLDSDTKECKKTRIKLFNSVESSAAAFSFQENGFQFVNDFGPSLTKSIENCATNYDEDGFSWILIECKEDISKNLIKYLQEWGRRNIQNFNPESGDFVFPLGELNYRNQHLSDKDVERRMKPLHLAHADFNKKQLISNINKNIEQYKPEIDSLLKRDVSIEECLNLEIIQVINVWMSLNFAESNNSLALLDVTSIDSSNDLFPYAIDSDSLSMSIFPNEEQRWVATKSLLVGQGIIFNSFLTIHTAINLNPGNVPRKSMDGRFVYCRIPK